MPKTKRKKIANKKKSGLTKQKKLALVKGCQASPLTVADYAKANKVAESTLYRWADLAGVSLKPMRKKGGTEEADSNHPIKPGRPETQEKKSESEKQELPKLEVSYIVQEFLVILKDMVKSAIRRISGKND